MIQRRYNKLHSICTIHDYLCFLYLFLPPRYNRNIVESGVKHHNHNPLSILHFTMDLGFITAFGNNNLKNWQFFFKETNK
jgi:hypothetical protein